MSFFTAKYVKSERGKIIVFSAAYKHSEFSRFNPVTAGFISFGVNADGNPKCSCYGHSVSLNLQSDSEEDTRLAGLQILDNRSF